MSHLPSSFQQTNVMINGVALNARHAQLGTEKANQALVDVKRIIKDNNTSLLREKMTTDPFFVNYICGRPMLSSRDVPALPSELKTQLAVMLLSCPGKSSIATYRSMWEAPRMGENFKMLDPSYYSLADGIAFALSSHDEHVYLRACFEARRMMMVSRYRDFHFQKYANEIGFARTYRDLDSEDTIVQAVQCAVVRLEQLDESECYALARKVAAMTNQSLAVQSKSQKNDQSLQLGQILSRIKNRDDKFWSKLAACFYEENQVIVLDDGAQSVTLDDVEAKGHLPVHVYGRVKRTLGGSDEEDNLEATRLLDMALDLFQSSNPKGTTTITVHGNEKEQLDCFGCFCRALQIGNGLQQAAGHITNLNERFRLNGALVFWSMALQKIMAGELQFVTTAKGGLRLQDVLSILLYRSRLFEINRKYFDASTTYDLLGSPHEVRVDVWAVIRAVLGKLVLTTEKKFLSTVAHIETVNVTGMDKDSLAYKIHIAALSRQHLSEGELLFGKGALFGELVFHASGRRLLNTADLWCSAGTWLVGNGYLAYRSDGMRVLLDREDCFEIAMKLEPTHAASQYYLSVVQRGWPVDSEVKPYTPNSGPGKRMPHIEVDELKSFDYNKNTSTQIVEDYILMHRASAKPGDGGCCTVI